MCVDEVLFKLYSTALSSQLQKFKIHNFLKEWIFCWNLLCLQHDFELPNLKTCAHTDIKILGINLGMGYNLVKHSRDAVHVKRIFFWYTRFWCETCESLNVSVTSHNSCSHGSLHPWLQSLEVIFFPNINFIYRKICKLIFPTPIYTYQLSTNKAALLPSQ